MIAGLFEKGAMPALERLVQFTSRRQAVLADDIANLSTPYFKPRDLAPKAFQATLRAAIDRRRGGAAPTSGPLRPADTDELKFTPDRIEIRPQATNDNILFHDQNNRDLERIMQSLAENTLAHNAGVQLLTNQFDMLKLAIRERI